MDFDWYQSNQQNQQNVQNQQYVQARHPNFSPTCFCSLQLMSFLK